MPIAAKALLFTEPLRYAAAVISRGWQQNVREIYPKAPVIDLTHGRVRQPAGLVNPPAGPRGVRFVRMAHTQCKWPMGHSGVAGEGGDPAPAPHKHCACGPGHGPRV